MLLRMFSLLACGQWLCCHQMLPSWPPGSSADSRVQVDLVKEPKEAFENVPEAAAGDKKEPTLANIRFIDKTRSKEQVREEPCLLVLCSHRLRTSL